MILRSFNLKVIYIILIFLLVSAYQATLLLEADLHSHYMCNHFSYKFCIFGSSHLILFSQIMTKIGKNVCYNIIKDRKLLVDGISLCSVAIPN